MSETILVTGCSGLLGSSLVELAKERYELYGTYYQNKPDLIDNELKMDLREKKEIEEAFEEARPDKVVHTAAYTDVDGCEKNKELAREINVEGTEKIAKESQKHDSDLLYVSTDYVFPGQKRGYKEGDKLEPLNTYGKTKYLGEKAVKELDNSLICRVCVLYGLHPFEKPNFATWLLNELREVNEVDLVRDQYVTPTLETDAAKAMLHLLRENKRGTYHLASRDCLDRYRFGLMLGKVFNLDIDLINEVEVSDLGWLAPRPKKSCLNTKKIEEEGYRMKNNFEALRELKERGA